MSSQVLSMIESAPYDVNTASKLESAVTTQLQTKTYDYLINKALLKNYQVNTTIIKPEFVCNVLILSLMRLPSSDFLSLCYIIPTSMMTNPNVIIIKKCASLLERGKFRDFWEQFVQSQTLFAEAQGFVDYIRVFIVSNLRDTFKNIPKAVFQQQVSLDDTNVVLFCNSNKMIEKISSEDIVEFALNDENQNKSFREETMKMNEVNKQNVT